MDLEVIQNVSDRIIALAEYKEELLQMHMGWKERPLMFP